MALPANVGVCQIQGRFIRAVVDGSDADRDPDGIPVEGLKVVLTASVPRVRDSSVPVTIILDPITATTDADGVLVGPDGTAGVSVVASDDPGLDPHGWTYKAALSAPSVASFSFDLAAPAGGVVDLTTVVPVPSSPGQSLDAWLQAVAAAQAAQAAAEAAADRAEAAGGADPAVIGQAVDDYLTAHPVAAPVDSVNGKVGTVVLTASDVGAASTAQGALADTAVQPGDLPAPVDTTGLEHMLTAGTNVTIDRTDPAHPVISAAGSTGVAGVSSVNTKTGDVVLSAADVGALTQSDGDGRYATTAQGAKADTALQDSTAFATAAQGVLADTAVQPAALGSLVPSARTVNGKPLTGDVTLGAADVGAATAAQGAKADAAVPGTRKVAGKALTADVTLAVADVSGAAPVASPTFTGVPKAPTAAAGTATTQLATTQFVAAGLAASAGLSVVAAAGSPVAAVKVWVGPEASLPGTLDASTLYYSY